MPRGARHPAGREGKAWNTEGYGKLSASHAPSSAGVRPLGARAPLRPCAIAGKQPSAGFDRRPAACRNHPMQLWFALASLASVSALNAGVRVQPHLPTTRIGRVVPARCVLAEAEEPGGLKQFAIDAGITTMRLGTCALMIHHGFDKVQVTLTGA